MFNFNCKNSKTNLFYKFFNFSTAGTLKIIIAPNSYFMWF